MAEEGNADIFVMDLETKKIKRLTYNAAIETAPSWSPTGREIAFTTDRLGQGSPQIYIMDAEGSNVRKASFGGNYHDAPAWAPTSERIAFVSRVDNTFDIYVLNLRTNQITKLTENNVRNESPSWSPDGRHLVFASNLSGSIQIYIGRLRRGQPQAADRPRREQAPQLDQLGLGVSPPSAPVTLRYAWLTRAGSLFADQGSPIQGPRRPSFLRYSSDTQLRAAPLRIWSSARPESAPRRPGGSLKGGNRRDQGRNVLTRPLLTGYKRAGKQRRAVASEGRRRDL